jgi:hypothetical protein
MTEETPDSSSKDGKCLAHVSSGLIEHQYDTPICTSAYRLSEVLERRSEMPWPAETSPPVPNKSIGLPPARLRTTGASTVR